MYDKGKEETHPSYAQLSFNRVNSSTGETFYGSDLEHNTFIQMELNHSTKTRGLNSDWHYAGKRIVSVRMSQNQFSELITSMNMGGGIPVTLTYTEQDGTIEAPTFDSKVAIQKAEFENMTKDIGADLMDLQETMNELLSGSGTVKKEDRKAMLAKVRNVVQDLTANLPYMEECAKESIDKSLTEAKGTIEAWFQHRVTSAGVNALNDESLSAPKLIEGNKSDED